MTTDREMTIWKYTLHRVDIQEVAMPAFAKVLHVAMQSGEITLWAWVDSKQPRSPRVFAIVGTGNPAPDFESGIYHGSVFDTPFVWHIFEEQEDAQEEDQSGVLGAR